MTQTLNHNDGNNEPYDDAAEKAAVKQLVEKLAGLEMATKDLVEKERATKKEVFFVKEGGNPIIAFYGSNQAAIKCFPLSLLAAAFPSSSDQRDPASSRKTEPPAADEERERESGDKEGQREWMR